MLYRMYRYSIPKKKYTKKIKETLKKKQHLNIVKAFKQNFGLQKAGMFDPCGFFFGVNL